jgi:hypothetical protein
VRVFTERASQNGRMPRRAADSDDYGMAIHAHQSARLQSDDRELVDLLTGVLTDPDLHTDTRMRLHEEIAEILSGARLALHSAGGGRAREHALDEHDGPLPDVLASVLVDPNLHTDTRMRLHQEISEILASAAAPRSQ